MDTKTLLLGYKMVAKIQTWYLGRNLIKLFMEYQIYTQQEPGGIYVASTYLILAN